MEESPSAAHAAPPTRRPPEILAPAGDAQALRAALAHGADAVYFGLDSGFNARARAANFPLAELPETVARIHRAGARAYVTLNTLVFEPELEAVERLVARAAAAGVDALIVQDPAVALIAREACPGLEVHASTQMTIANAAAARFAAELGATRVVLPRELSVAEIRRFVDEAAIETEVFVHGALCVSWSGQCLTSEAWGQRSANRGQCAQSCRMPYTLEVDGRSRPLGDVAYLLSPRDLAGVRAVPELIRLGVEGLKIEGRQKGPGYVATAVAGYRRWRDAQVRGDDPARAGRELQEDLRDMSLSYSRGFGDGFLAGSDHQTLVEGRFPKHRGLCLGRVLEVRGRSVVVVPSGDERPWTGGLAADARAAAPEGRVASPLAGCGGGDDDASGPATATPEPRPGHGVVFDAGDPEDADEPGGPVFAVEPEGRGWRLTFGIPGPDLGRVSPGQRVWITSDPKLNARTERTLKAPEPEGRHRVRIAVSGRAGAPLALVARSGTHSVAVAGRAPAAPARKAGLDEALLREKLGAFGGTPFRLEALELDGLEAGLFVPTSELKELRRRIVAELLPRIERGPERPPPSAGALDRARARTAVPLPEASGAPEAALRVLCRNDDQLSAVIAAGLPHVELEWMEWVGLGHAVARAREAGLSVGLATLRVQKPGEEAYDQLLERLAPDALLLRHFGAVMHFVDREPGAWRPELEGDFSLNVTNSLTAGHLLTRGLDRLTAAHDLDEAQLLALAGAMPAARLTVVLHHRIPTFHTEHCVYSHLLSAGRDHRSCGRPCERHEVALGDHRGRRHPVIVDAGCRNTVFDAEAQSTAPLVPRLRAAGVRRFRIELVRESGAETRRLIEVYSELLSGRRSPESVLRTLGVPARQGLCDAPMALIV